MASSSLQKLLRIRRQSQSASRLLAFLAQNQIPQIGKPCDPTSFAAHPETDHPKQNQSSCAHVYPSFPFGFFLDPISPTPFIRTEPEGDMVPDESDVIIRADSVKKKRKKKMNKHKLRKLRKRLRRKTKT